MASGGFQRSFETQVGLFRRTPGTTEFTQIVAPGTAISLGEVLLLRAAVREGDGRLYLQKHRLLADIVCIVHRIMNNTIKAASAQTLVFRPQLCVVLALKLIMNTTVN